jgi:hypothetical protein
MRHEVTSTQLLNEVLQQRQRQQQQQQSKYGALTMTSCTKLVLPNSRRTKPGPNVNPKTAGGC